MKCWRKPLNEDLISPVHHYVYILKDRCKGCRLCIEFCPRQALQESTGFNYKGYHFALADNDACLGCGLCELICPEFAITVSLLEKKNHG